MDKPPVTVVCVNVGPKYSMEYVTILRDMVGRALPREHRFLCITDRPGEIPADMGIEAVEPEPGLPGWWQKIACFKPGKLPAGRLMFFDLDVAIVGELDTLADTPGIIKDWHVPTYNSSVMVWDSGEHAAVWGRFTPDVMARLPGDQDWITEASDWPLFPAEWCVSFRSHAQQWPPGGAKVVVFHGEPKPAQLTDGWVAEVWKIGGLTPTPKFTGMNVTDEAALANVRAALDLDLPWFTGAPARPGEALIIGGAPSLRDHLPDIRRRQAKGAKVISLNGTLRWLMERRIKPDCHVQLDARPENVGFLEDAPRGVVYLIASQSHPDVFRTMADRPHGEVILWHAGLGAEMEELLKPCMRTRPTVIVHGGSTVGLRAMYLAHLSGYRRIRCYGMDSSYAEDRHHAYAQPLNDGEPRMRIIMAGKPYSCAPWMARQANEFREQHEALTREGSRVWVHGRGLIPDMAAILNRETRAAA